MRGATQHPPRLPRRHIPSSCSCRIVFHASFAFVFWGLHLRLPAPIRPRLYITAGARSDRGNEQPPPGSRPTTRPAPPRRATAARGRPLVSAPRPAHAAGIRGLAHRELHVHRRPPITAQTRQSQGTSPPTATEHSTAAASFGAHRSTAAFGAAGRRQRPRHCSNARRSSRAQFSSSNPSRKMSTRRAPFGPRRTPPTAPLQHGAEVRDARRQRRRASRGRHARLDAGAQRARRTSSTFLTIESIIPRAPPAATAI